MNKFKLSGLVMAGGGGLSRQDWMFILSILLTILGMIQDYLSNRE